MQEKDINKWNSENKQLKKEVKILKQLNEDL